MARINQSKPGEEDYVARFAQFQFIVSLSRLTPQVMAAHLSHDYAALFLPQQST